MSQLSRQLWILGVALLVWALWGEPALWAAVVSYLGAWILFNWGGWAKLEIERMSRPVAISVVALLLAAPLLLLGPRARALMMREGLLGLGERLSDRLRLERLPAIAPPLVVADQPQTFYLYAPQGAHASLSFGGQPLAATDLGHGVFRVEYDPRRDGPPLGAARIEIDGVAFSRDVQVVVADAHPRWFASDPKRGLAVAVSEETDELLLLDREGALRRLAVGDGPTDVVLVDDGRKAVVSHRYSREGFVVDTERAEVVARPELGPFAVRLAVSPSGRRIAVSLEGRRRGVTVLELPDLRPIAYTPLPYTPDWLTFVDDEALAVAVKEPRALVRVVQKRDGWGLVGAPLYLGRPVVTAARRPGTDEWYLATTAYRSDGGMPEGNHFIQDQILAVDLERFEVVDQFLTARGGSPQDDPGVVVSGGSPMGMAFGDDGRLLVALAGTDEIWRLPAGSHQPEVLLDARRSDVPLYAPHGVADLGGGRWAASSPAQGIVAVFESDGRAVAVHRLTPTDEELQTSDPAALARRRGERAFYESTRTGLSCQSCHLHAGNDGCAHDITPKGKEPMALKGTISTRGVAGTAPYLRNGDFPRVRDLADVTRFPYRRVLPDRGALLDAYVVGLALPLNPRALEGRDVDRERRGLDAFVKARCDLCHVPPAFSNLGQHATRAVFPRYGGRAGDVLDTPSLLGLWSSSPYLVDGRAATLEAVLDDKSADNHHGDVAALSEDERADLVLFLESL